MKMLEETVMLEETRAFLSRVLVPGAPTMTSLPVEQARRMVNGAIDLLERPAPALPRIETFTIPGPAGELPVRLYDPQNTGGDAPVVLFFHGGGWVFGNLHSHNSLCADIADRLGLRVLAVDYRLAPEHPFPAALEDAAAAAEWLAASPDGQLDAMNGGVTGLILAGDSAGGNLAAVLARQLAGKAAIPVLGQLLLYPAVDMIGTYASAKSFAQGYMLDEDDLAFFSSAYLPRRALRADPRVSPLLAESFEGLPPTVVVTCGLDPLRDQGRAYAERLAEAGVPVHYEEFEGQIHGCFTMRKALPSAHQRLLHCLDILRGMLH